MFEEADNFADFFRGGLPYYLLITLPIFIICSSNPVLASSEFSVQRMSQFDVHGVSYGCRSAALNLEAKSLHTWTTSRHCIVTRFQDMTIDQFREIRAKAGGLILLLPQDISILTLDEKEHIYMLEQAILSQEITIPVYFSKYNTELNTIIDDLSIVDDVSSTATNDGNGIGTTKNQRQSALSEIVNSISANGYQVVISGVTNTPNKQSKIPIYQGELTPLDANNKIPMIIITSHMNTFGLMNDHYIDYDVAVFLTLADIFSKMHVTTNSVPKYKLLFLLSESGVLLNFQGMKKWLDSNLDENVQMQVQNAEFVLCLDSISELNGLDSIFMHVSKPPKDGSGMNNFYKQFKVLAQKYGNVSVEGVHKKINLADVQLAWEHERFSMRRMSAFTLSGIKSHKDLSRTTMFNDNPTQRLGTAQRNAKIIAESLASYIYGNKDDEIFSGPMSITEDSIKPFLHIHSTLLSNDLKNAYNKYLKNVKITYDKPDAREPDFMLYEGHEGTLHVYNVKPAVFDLFLTFVIIAYLGSIYFVIILFPNLYAAICKISTNNSNNNNNNINSNNINNNYGNTKVKYN